MSRVKQVVVVNGYPGAGKDTVIDMIVDLLPGPRFTSIGEKLSSVDHVKRAARLLGWPGDKDEKGRDFLSDLKDVSDVYYDTSTKRIIQLVDTSECDYVFVMVREPVQIEKLKTYYGTKFCSLLVRSPRELTGFTNTGDSGILNWSYDYIIHNDGDFADLKEKAEKFVLYLIEEKGLQP